MRISHPKEHWSLLRSITSVTFAKTQETSNPLQLTLLGGGGTTPYSYYPLAVTPAQRALFGRVFLSVLMLQISSQFVKCRRQSLPHEFTEI